MKNKNGSIIFISSTSAKRNDIGRFAYSSTKPQFRLRHESLLKN